MNEEMKTPQEKKAISLDDWEKRKFEIGRYLMMLSERLTNEEAIKIIERRLNRQ